MSEIDFQNGLVVGVVMAGKNGLVGQGIIQGGGGGGGFSYEIVTPLLTGVPTVEVQN